MNRLHTFMCLWGILLPTLAFSIGPYKVGDHLTVHAGSGLVLRASASPTGAKVATLDYGTVVTVLADKQPKMTHSVVFFKGYTVKGYWVRVRAERNQEGYVFDGFLSAYQTPSMLPNGDDPNDPEGTLSIQERYILLHSTKKGAPVDLEKIETTYQHYKQLFVNGDAVEVDNGEGGSEYVIRFHKGVTLEEGYLIGKSLWMEMSDVTFTSTYAKGGVVLSSTDGLFEVEVRAKIGITEVFMRHAD
jgi:hypothetical protein